MNAPEQGFRLEELRVEPQSGEISGPGGHETLDPKVMDVLVLMARHAGRVVPREDLLTELWPGVVVTDDALTRCFYELRRKLSQAGGNERYRTLIETLPKRGYRLNGSVTSIIQPPVEAPPQARRGRRLAAAGIGLAVVVLAAVVGAWYLARSPEPAPPKSVAVLPFVDMSEGQDQQYFSDGITEEILDRLAKNEGQLRVIARTSSFSFRNQASDIPEIAAKLNVSHILEGSVRRSGDRVRITAQLVEGADASHVWSETYDRTLGDLFAVQDDIAAAVAKALEAALAGDATQGEMSVSAAAHDEYLQAKFLYERRAPGDIERAIRYLEAAVAREPAYARAWSVLAGAYSIMWWDLGHNQAIWKKRQGDAARKAVELDPELVEARTRLAEYYLDVSDYKRAVEQLRKASELDPADPWLARFAEGVGSWHGESLEQQIAEDRTQLQDDPYSAVKHGNLGLLLFATGHLNEALSEFRKTMELSPAAGWDKQLEIGRVLVAQRRYDEAHAEFMQLPAEARDYGLALLHRAPGRLAEADAALERLKQRSGNHMHGIRLAEALYLRGMDDEAFATLRRTKNALTRDESILTRIWVFQREMRLSPFLRPLHGDARWVALMAFPQGDSAQEIIERLWPSGEPA